MTYSYYHASVKPKPKTKAKKGYVCKICGYVFDGENIPDDFICPTCKHPRSDFEEIKESDQPSEKYVCACCGWTYDEARGYEESGILPGTKFENLPEDFTCPICSVGKDLILKA